MSARECLSSGDDVLNVSALVVGPRDGAGALLMDLARELGFARVERYRGLSSAERLAEATPLLFFLCAAVPDVQALRPTAETVRYASNPTVRFAPLIYFTHDPSVATIRPCVQMGFDDVIALPFVAGDLRARLARQVERQLVYYETTTYFGPDRRNGAREAPGPTAGPFRRIEIIRRLASGIDIMTGGEQVEQFEV